MSMAKMQSAITVIIVGIAIWFIALIVAFGIGASENAKWTCVAGITFGVLGLRYTIRRAKHEQI
jgi:uncharacterized membrane-anchored protein